MALEAITSVTIVRRAHVSLAPCPQSFFPSVPWCHGAIMYRGHLILILLLLLLLLLRSSV